MIILILGFAALVSAKTPSLPLHNSLEPPLDYIPVNSGAHIPSSKLASDSERIDSKFPGYGYLHPLCPNGKAPPCEPRSPPIDSKFPGLGYLHPLCPNGKAPPCEPQPTTPKPPTPKPPTPKPPTPKPPQPPTSKKCPDGSSPPCGKTTEQTCPNGQPPPCVCKYPLIGTPPYCQALPYLPTVVKPKCPPGTFGTPPNCKVFEIRPIPCPNGQGDFYPNCVFKTCPPGLVGIYPNCKEPVILPSCYKERKLGTWPDCYDPCPAYQMGRPDKEPFCRPIPCSKGKGWSGDFLPNCVYTPMCPDHAPGVWPNCQPYYCKANFQGIYPDCVCPEKFILISEDVCFKPPEHNPLSRES